MKAKSVFRTLELLVAALSFTWSAPGAAHEHGHPSSRLKVAIVRGAELQRSRQGTYTNADTGVGVYDCAWEWEIGSGLAYRNTQGASARGLVAAYRLTRQRALLTGAVCAAQQVLRRSEANPTERRFFGDLLLLSDLAEATFSHVWAARARAAFAVIRAEFPTGAALVAHHLARGSLAGWDVATQIEVAVAVEQDDYARELAAEIVARRAEWEHFPSGDTDYTLLSQAALLEALAGLERRGGGARRSIRGYRGEVRRHLLDAQGLDGSWADGDFQTTAFALRGLLAEPDRREDARRSVAGAQRYLLATETAEGGWASEVGGENAQVNSEVLVALVAAAMEADGGDGHDCRQDFDEPRPGRRGHRGARASEPPAPPLKLDARVP